MTADPQQVDSGDSQLIVNGNLVLVANHHPRFDQKWITLPLTNIFAPELLDGWKTSSLSFWGQFGPIFQGYQLAVDFQGPVCLQKVGFSTTS